MMIFINMLFFVSNICYIKKYVRNINKKLHVIKSKVHMEKESGGMSWRIKALKELNSTIAN